MSEWFSVLMDRAIGERRISGSNILVIKDGEERFFGSFGKADIEHDIPMKRDTVFRMFSMSKTVTAAAVMLLVERGIIDLLDNVENYLPGFANPMVAVADEPAANGDARGKKFHLEPAKRSVTIADLMTMTSGVCYPGIETAAHIAVDKCLAEWEKKMPTAGYPVTVEFANAIGRCPLAFNPGEHWMYGFSADILGAVVEVASGRRFGDFLRDEIFVPLGMMSTSFDMLPGFRERLACVYETDPETGSLREFKGMNLGLGNYPEHAYFESGGAGLLSTIDDFAKFGMMLANGGKLGDKRILGENTVRYMRTNALTDEVKNRDMNWGSTVGYGYNCLMRILDKPTVQGTIAPEGEFGWDGWLGTYFIMEPASKSVILYFIQKTNSGCDDITRKVRAIAYGQYLND
jgi:CubicO group peptidase (beta-lactamase class C family)